MKKCLDNFEKRRTEEEKKEKFGAWCLFASVKG